MPSTGDCVQPGSTDFDVFNGDADGLCALHQLRLVEPRDATLVTGCKRDIALVERLPLVPGARVTVLDLSLARNRDAVLQRLACGMVFTYFDHHAPGAPLEHAGLTRHIDTAADVCTSVLVDRHLQGAHRRWAVVGAFGDNLAATALQLGASLGLTPAQLARLRELGENLNYNAYGDQQADLFIPTAEVYRRMQAYADPLRFIDAEPVLQTIRKGYQSDLAHARRVRPQQAGSGAMVWRLPDARWSRRIRGVLANTLVQDHPDQAHAVIAADGRGGHVVSVRAPRARPGGAAELCMAFPTGGGRSGAAGIDHLPDDQVAGFVRAFARAFGHEGASGA
jgi:hypothetical protein